IISFLTKIMGRGNAFKFLFNISPMYRSTGGRLIEVDDDLHYVKIKLSLNYKTKNYVGTLYGGHMYSCVDGIFMVQLINILKDDYVVWDKSASIRFKRPGNQTLYAEFQISDAFIEQIKTEIAEQNEKDYTLQVDLKDKEGKLYAEVEKVIYIASKAYYKQKRRNKKRS
ncbi:MAG: DUF4442 domain-containing protein, partial [Chitinophagales bacterium]